MTMYTILAYITIFRIAELGYQRFKEVVLSLEPSKIANFVSYVFNTVIRFSLFSFIEHFLSLNYHRKTSGILIAPAG